MTPVKAILFDADGVLQHPSADLEERLEAALGFLPDPLEAFFEDVFVAEGRALTGAADFLEALTPVVDQWGAPGTAARVVECWSAIEPHHGVAKLIEGLRNSGYFCALATNQQSYRGRHMAEALGYRARFDHCFYSWEVGYSKPDTRYFEAIAATLPFSPPEMLFIDDREDNVAAAVAVGIRGAQYFNSRDERALPTLIEILERFLGRGF